jgi:hypothetical protein
MGALSQQYNGVLKLHDFNGLTSFLPVCTGGSAGQDGWRENAAGSAFSPAGRTVTFR